MFLGIDIGTSKAAAVIADEAGRAVAAVSRHHGADAAGRAGRSEQDVSALLAAAWATVADLPADLRRRARAVGLTGQMHGVALVDADGRPCSPFITWQDGRCSPDFLEELAAATGYRLSTGFGCATLAWLGREGLIPADAQAAATINDLAAAVLTGATRPVTDPTNAAGWGLFDLKRLAWDREAVQAAGIPLRLMPDVVPCGSRIGAVAPTMARILGLPEGIPVAAAIGDNQASLVATLTEPEVELALTLGTGGQVSAVMPAGATIDPADRADTFQYRPYPGGRYAVVAASLCGGAAWAWLADAVAAWLKDLGIPCPPRDVLFAELNRLGLESDAWLPVRPHFLGERHRPDLRGVIQGLDLENFRLGPLARGLARGIVSNLRDMMPPWALAGRTRLVGSGNAIRRNVLIQRMAEDVFGLPLALTEEGEEAALGAAILAGRLAKH